MLQPHPTTPDVLVGTDGFLGRLRLNRPATINALTDDMVVAMLDVLAAWADDDRVEAVLLDGAGDRGFCSGGDVRTLREAILDGRDDPLQFWVREYELDGLIARYPKPVWVLMNGVTMGGGLGLSAYARHRLVTSDARIAMPETAIGFFPDVGMTYLLARAPGELGTHVALTGTPVTAADALLLGFADQLVADGDGLAAAIVEGEALEVLTPPPAPLEQQRPWIDECYAGDDAAAILARLQAHDVPEAREAGRTIAGRSPYSVAATLEAVRRAATMTLDEVLAQDGRLGAAFLHAPDFVEGVRAVLVDKDHAPTWSHTHVRDVSRREVLAAFGAAPS